MSNKTDSGKISTVVTCYNEEQSIDEFFARLHSTLQSLGRPFEIVMTNDGSHDASWEKLKSIYEKEENVVCIMDFFKNSGQQAALTAGMIEATGDIIMFMDSDLQLSPEDLPLLMAEYDKGFDVVSGRRENRKDPLLRRLPSKIANIIMRTASRSDFRDFGCTFKLYNAAIIRAMDLGPHRLFSNVDAIPLCGRRKEVAVSHRERKYGESGWTFRKLWRYNMDNFVIISERPFQYVAAFGLFVAIFVALRVGIDLLAAFQVMDTVSNGLLLNVGVAGIGVIVFILALIGEFTIRTFIMLKGSPHYVIRERVSRR